MTQPLAHTPLYEVHRQHGAKLVPFAGYQMPIQYAGIVAEHQAVRSCAGLFDASHMGELVVQGPDAIAAVDALVTNHLARLENGQAMYTCACNKEGGILDDLIVYRRGDEDIMIVCNASNRTKMVDHFSKNLQGNARFEDASEKYALLALQGPRALEFLSRVTQLESFPSSFRFAQSKVAGRDCLIARTGYTGEDGVELFTAPGDAATVWRALIEAGGTEGLSPAGLGARDTLRLEARLSLYGNDIDETTHPLEAGLGWTVKLDKGTFLGRDALQRYEEAGLKRKLVGFEMTGRGIARHGYPLCEPEGAEVGLCTSGGPAPTLGKNIGLGYLPVSMTAVGTAFDVNCRGKRVSAVVAKTPFYKRPKA